MTKLTRLTIFYEITMAPLAIIVVFILYLELTTPLIKSLTDLLSYIDFSVLIILRLFTYTGLSGRKRHVRIRF